MTDNDKLPTILEEVRDLRRDLSELQARVMRLERAHSPDQFEEAEPESEGME